MIENKYISLDVTVSARRLCSVQVYDKINGRRYDLGTDIFKLEVLDEKTDEACSKKEFMDTTHSLTARDLLGATMSVDTITADPEARRLAARKAGQRVNVKFSTPTDGNIICWWAELREDSPYIRVGLDIYPGQFTMPVREICLLDIQVPEARVEGNVKGAPAVAAGQRLFAGIENPNSHVEVSPQGLRCLLKRKTDLPRRADSTISAVLGFSEPSQLRRRFQIDYLNAERARPYSTCLNYNSWYDIGYFTRFNEEDALDVIRTIGEELVVKRGVVVDNFVMDDGWDDIETLWEFHAGMPNEFAEVKKLSHHYNSAPGVWMSPWGGYGEPKIKRLEAAEKRTEEEGRFETNERGFALTGETYYNHFRDICLKMVREQGITHFKLDGTSGEAAPAPGSPFGSDLEAISSLLEEVRTECPEVFINLSTGTWASPFWFNVADSIWRGNWDHDFCGEGSKRQQWITFRDAMIYENNAEISPLFPINSLMTHGLIYNKGAHGLIETEGDDLACEIWSGFGLGTQMQELYITPSMLSDKDWDELATAAKWARAKGDIMVDSHWLGGNPADMEVYGWAAWQNGEGLIVLRNPSATEQSFSFDPAAVFELPLGAACKYGVSSPKGDALPFDILEAGRIETIKLKPFAIIVIDAKSI